MDEKIAAFHILSRKYLIEILQNLKNELLELSKKVEKILEETDDYQDKRIMDLNMDLNIRYPYWYVRRDILSVILIRIESISPKDFNSLDEIKKIVIQEYEKANISERKHYSDISKELRISICNEEKQKFYDYISNIDENSLKEVDELFYRRVISDEKIKEIKKRINEKRNNVEFEGKDFMWFNREYFRNEININDLLDIFRRKKIERIYEINTGGIDSASYLMDLSALDFYFTDGFNIYWCSDEMNWMIEENHEDFYLIYGEWLIKEIKRIRPNWKEGIFDRL
ncbi:hypothetical protein R9X47_28530 [Wukongibacter baidiensis]|uniref:hypothetical protein n=1 Tax=Wukongibacter baidiensis TaxID=1723361 RepID=UPI003D7FDF4B